MMDKPKDTVNIIQLAKLALMLMMATVCLSKQIISVPPIDSNDFRTGFISIYQSSRNKVARTIEINSFSKVFQSAFTNNAPNVALAVSSFKGRYIIINVGDNDANTGINFEISIRLITVGGFHFTVKNWNYIHQFDVSFIAVSPTYPGRVSLNP